MNNDMKAVIRVCDRWAVSLKLTETDATVIDFRVTRCMTRQGGAHIREGPFRLVRFSTTVAVALISIPDFEPVRI